MGKALLVQLSDIHVKSSSDPILRRADAIAAAVQDLDLSLSAAVIVVTGDVAFSGLEAQYDAAWDFLLKVCERLQKRLATGADDKTVPTSIVAIPGNHDCDHSILGKVRALLIDSIIANPSEANDESVVSTCLEVQKAFFDYLDIFGDEIDEAEHFDRLAYRYVINVGNEQLVFLCFNTAWISQKHESQGKILLPERVLPSARPKGDVIVSLYHHPTNWMPPVVARSTRESLEAVSDMLMTGHEHVSTVRTQQYSSQQGNTVVEGGVLQETGVPDTSTFNAFVIDLTERKQKAVRLEWDGSRYIPAGLIDSTGNDIDLEWGDLPTARIRDRSSVRLGAEMFERLGDLGIPIHHKNRGVVGLSDVFVYPDIQAVTSSPETSVKVVRGHAIPTLLQDAPRLLIIGDGKSGKTSLAKSAYLELYNSGYVPLFINGDQSPMLGDRFLGYITHIFKQQYDEEGVATYMQLDRSNRVIIVDDYEKLSIPTRKQERFLEEIGRFAGRILLFANSLQQTANELVVPGGRAELKAAFAKYQILPMNRSRRDEIIEKWMILDEDLVADVAAFAHQRDELVRVLNVLTANGRLPRYPEYILTVLNGASITTAMNTQVGTFGAYYEIMIRGTLGRSRPPQEFNKAVAYLSDLAYHLFDSSKRVIDSSEFSSFHRDYETRHALRI